MRKVDKSRIVQMNNNPGYLIVKRVMDITCSIFGLLILSPVFLIVSFLIWKEDGGPVIFTQERNGINNCVFKMYKFRSMIKNAPNMRQELSEFNKLDGPAFKMKNDPRITKVGAFIRKTSIDELPQLLNVIKGDMSLIGPRPLPTYETAECDEYQLQRLLVRPGLSCYWQILGRNDISFDEWMEMDLDYIEEASVITDLKILLLTAKAVLSGKGAY